MSRRKALALALGAVAALAGTVLFLWADLHARSARAIDRHEEEAHRAFAGLRARHAAAPRLSDLLAPAWAQDPDFSAVAGRYLSPQELRRRSELAARGVFFEYESDGEDALFMGSFFISSILVYEPPEPSPEKALALVALAEDAYRGGGVGSAGTRLCLERRLLESWPDRLYGHELGAAELETLARMLDRVEEARPPLSDALEAQHAMDRIALIQVLRTRSNPRLFNQASPDWRSLYSAKMLFAKVLNEMDRNHRRVQEIARLPVHERPAAAKKLEEEARAAGEPPTRAEIPFVAGLFVREAEAHCLWALARAATAVARYQAEEREDPPDLEALVPRYLSRLPDCPSLRYAAGEVFVVGADGKRPQVIWNDYVDLR
jgi:hypothetical protein